MNPSVTLSVPVCRNSMGIVGLFHRRGGRGLGGLTSAAIQPLPAVRSLGRHLVRSYLDKSPPRDCPRSPRTSAHFGRGRAESRGLSVPPPHVCWATREPRFAVSRDGVCVPAVAQPRRSAASGGVYICSFNPGLRSWSGTCARSWRPAAADTKRLAAVF